MPAAEQPATGTEMQGTGEAVPAPGPESPVGEAEKEEKPKSKRKQKKDERRKVIEPGEEGASAEPSVVEHANDTPPSEANVEVEASEVKTEGGEI